MTRAFLPFFKAAYRYHFIESDAGSERHEGEKTLTKLLFQREPFLVWIVGKTISTLLVLVHETVKVSHTCINNPCDL